ncbi:MAG TPA: efflux transporter outer membrane subunit [Bryobacteraceae bacterium]|jgi:NodT family efflux transporter outer membrane factor (OMF) lipoprotein|nr:efflux transporter outer membrane subunit [Bryobacteraceae bacterium]
MPSTFLKKLAAITPILLSSACIVGPNYHRPAPVIAPAYKEAPPEAFKEAQAAGLEQANPSDAFAKGKWWEIYKDSTLNSLEEQVSISNQNVLMADAQYRQAKALVRVARSSLFPTLTAGPSITQEHLGSGSANVSGTRSAFSLPLDVSWEPDLWGSIRRGVTAAAATAQASYALLENAKLLYQSELATDYFQLHGIDGDADLLKRTASSYQEYLTLTRNRFAGGIASDLDVAQAESQLYGTQSELIDLGIARAQFEHAIAVLAGKPPSEISIGPALLTAPPPPIPIGVPSQLLERRPDIANSERLVAAANEQIGIAMAAFYPTLTLSASAGFTGGSLAKWFSLPSRFWSVGPALAETLFDAGLRRAVVAEQQAAYDATVATYRQTALTAFQQVEDQLASLRIMEEETAKVAQTVTAADRALTVSTAQYKAGTTDFLTVITAQATLVTAQRTAVELLTRRLVSSVSLVQALGGGWDASQMPTQTDVRKSN